MRFSKDEIAEYLNIENKELRCTFALNALCQSCKDEDYNEFIRSNEKSLLNVLESIDVSSSVFNIVVERYFTFDKLSAIVS